MSGNTSETGAGCIHTTTFINTEIEQLFGDIIDGGNDSVINLNNNIKENFKKPGYLHAVQNVYKTLSIDNKISLLSRVIHYTISCQKETLPPRGTFIMHQDIIKQEHLGGILQLSCILNIGEINASSYLIHSLFSILHEQLQHDVFNSRYHELGSLIRFQDYTYIQGKGWIKSSDEGELGPKDGITPISTQKLLQTKEFSFIGDNTEIDTFLESILQHYGMEAIHRNFGIASRQISLRNAIFVFRYLKGVNHEQGLNFKETLQDVYIKDNSGKAYDSFITSFLACSQDIGMGEKIIDIANTEGEVDVLNSFAALIYLENSIEHEDIDSSIFLKILIQRGKGLLEDTWKSIEKGETIKINLKYSTALVQSGAFIKAFIEKKKSGGKMTVEEFNKNPFFEIQTCKGGHIFKDGINPETLDVIDLMSDAPYKNPKIFGGRDYKMLYQNIYETYAGEDNGAVWVNIQGIISDLCNPDVTFYKMMEKEENSKGPVSICKIKKTGNNSIYYGSHYTSEAYQGDFGIGSVLSHIAFAEHPDTDIHALATVNNTALAYHINYEGFVGTVLSDLAIQNPTEIPTKNNEIRTGALIQLEKKREKSYTKKDKIHYPDNRIVEAAKEGNIDGYTVVCIDTSKANTQRYLDTIKNEFSHGKVITRFFYEMLGNIPDTTKTYIVFEPREQ